MRKSINCSSMIKNDSYSHLCLAYMEIFCLHDVTEDNIMGGSWEELVSFVYPGESHDWYVLTNLEAL